MQRRLILVAPLGLAARNAAAQTAWPTRAVSIVVPNAPGGGADITARLLAPLLQAATGQPFLVENRAGAATQIGTEYVVRAAPDGHTLLLAAAPLTINPALFPHLSYDALRDLAPVTMVIHFAQFLAVAAGSPLRDLAGLLAAARARPGGLSFGSAGTGSMGHMSMELLAARSGAPLTHVSYRGSGAALPDLVAGRLDGMFDNPSTVLPLVREGRVRVIAWTGPTRSPLAPEVPTVAESGFPGFATLNWNALFAPARTPPTVLERVHTAFTAALRRPEVVERLARDAVTAAPGTPEELADFVARETATWAEVVRERGIRPD